MIVAIEMIFCNIGLLQLIMKGNVLAELDILHKYCIHQMGCFKEYFQRDIMP